MLLLTCAASAIGCNTSKGGATPSNPFAQNSKTVPSPATFSSQESYLGQTLGTFVPQTPATTFSPAHQEPASSTQPSASPSNASVSETESSNEKVTVFTAAEQGSAWIPVETSSTSNTAFGMLEAKTNVASSEGSGATDSSESLVVGTSHMVTTVTGESQPMVSLSEPQQLYSGKFSE